MPEKTREEEEEEESKGSPHQRRPSNDKPDKKDGANLESHKVPKTHLSDKQEAAGSKPGADMKSKGISHATSVIGGAHGQAVGLPAPLPPKEAEEAGFVPKDKEQSED